MFTSMISVTNLRGNVKYPMTDKKDQAKHGPRVEAMIFGGGLLDTGSANTISRQFEYYLHLAGRQRRVDINGEYPILAYVKLISFSENEIARDDPEAVDKIINIVEKVQDNLAPDTVWFCVIQKDGPKSGLWHVHLVQCSVHSSTLKAMSGRETNYDYFREHVEAAAIEEGITLDYGKDHTKRDRRREHAQKKDGFNWLENLEERIAKAAQEARKMSEYEELLAANGVTVSRKTKRGWTYELSECEREEFIGKKARFDKFGSDFSQATLNKLFDQNYKQWAVSMERKGRDPRTGERRLPDESSIQQTGGYDMERGDDE